MREKANEKAQCEKCEEESSEEDVTHHVPLAQKHFLVVGVAMDGSRQSFFRFKDASC